MSGQGELFARDLASGDLASRDLAPDDLPAGVVVFRGAASDPALLTAARAILEAAPPRQMEVPGGGRMAAAMTSCGALGWVSDRNGYRYSPVDPQTGKPWPALADLLAGFATAQAARAGYPGFVPDSCLLNLYEAGAGMGLHQDRDEQDFSWPIVSLSFGARTRFRCGGQRRRDPLQDIALGHGDVLIFGGPARRMYHGVAVLRPDAADATGPLGPRRLNLTFRRAAGGA